MFAVKYFWIPQFFFLIRESFKTHKIELMGPLFILLSILGLARETAAAEPFELSCKVTDNLVLAVDEGKPQRYSGFSEGVEVGDQFRIVIYGGRFDPQRPNFPIIQSLGIKFDGLRDLSIDVAARHRLSVASWGVTFTSKLDQKKRSFENGRVYEKFVALGPDAIGFSHLSLTQTRTLRLERYYKNDWAGFLTTTTALRRVGSSQVMTFDCRGLNENLDRLFAELASSADNIRN